MNLAVSNNNTTSGGILDSILGLSLLSAYSSDASAQVIAMKRLHILYLESLEIQVVQSQDSYCVLDLKAKHECL